MRVVEIPENPNCAAMELRIFHDLEPPRPVSQVRLERESGPPQWCDVVGWSLEGAAQPAMAQKVEDSGEGVALLVFGHAAGLRLRPAGSRRPWRIDDPEQWGLPFILAADSSDVRFVEPTPKKNA